MKDIRKKIDDIDDAILDLLDKRADHVRRIGQIKIENSRGVYAPHREKEIVERIKKSHAGDSKGFPLDAKLSIFREVIAASRVLQKKLTICYLGPDATFTHQAASSHFSSHCDYTPAQSIAQVFRAVEKGRADFGVVPIENSTEGVVNHTLDMFFDSECKIWAELLMDVSHYLISAEKDISSVKKIYSHPMAFPQCALWIEENLPTAQLIEVSSTSKAAESAKNDKNAAAIASYKAAEIYGLDIIAEKIEDMKENITRFFIIGRDFPEPSEDSKTTIMFSIKDRVGVLHDMLEPFKKYSINMTKIESRPSRTKVWQYVFFIDFAGHIAEDRVKHALEELDKDCVFLKVLGSYAAASNTIKITS